ncbi:MAG TPA: endonuclease/exonuclease/phosphatase family protein [Baekduia sp.]|nr:endonuclease/exonuclease/phosphatase family protein [Baekduia sp.]
MRVLTWNLFHGRSVPDTRRSLLPEFTEAIAGWDWDAALLQEVPPWWPRALARATGAQERTVLTSRNAMPGLRRLVADRRPDLAKANGGGANAILARGAEIAGHAQLTVRRWPERRIVHAVRLGDVWVANLHASTHPDARIRADHARAAAAVQRWAGEAPALLGGDFNLADPSASGFSDAGGDGIDRFLTRGLTVADGPRALDRGTLSDHAPVLVEVVGSGA